ncbi:MAG: hypothetical protein LUI87_17720 [Lachnospiraceae bacterium]|nr:hypothetical protein [Lachnospiraceae bacterium]
MKLEHTETVDESVEKNMEDRTGDSAVHTFVFDAVSFSSVEAFAAYLQMLADDSKKKLQRKIRPLFLDDQHLEPGFEAWLQALGYEQALEAWKTEYQTGTADGETEEGVWQGSGAAGRGNAAQGQFPGAAGFMNTVYGQSYGSTGCGNASPGQTPGTAGFPRGGSGQLSGAWRFTDNPAELLMDESGDFEPRFFQMLKEYPQALDDSRRFTGMIRDLFPGNPMQARLMETLYQMDIVRAIRDAKTLNEMFPLRFVKRLTGDFGVREDYARWAAAVWCVCYGEKLLGKDCLVVVPPFAGVRTQ